MSVDYESVLIYGYCIPHENKNTAAIYRATGKEIWELEEIIENKYGREIMLIPDNNYSDPKYYYFGVPLGDEIQLDPTEAKGWIKNNQYKIMLAFTECFGEEIYEALDSPTLTLYHFVRIC